MRKYVSVPLMVAELETRQLLSASPVNYVFNAGQLTINGGSGADEISVQMKGDPAISKATVTVVVGHGRQSVTKTFEGVTNLGIYGNAGNDHIKLSGADLSSFFGVWTQVSGGEGNDVIRIANFDGGVSADGGNGNDLIDASRAFGKFALVGSSSFRFLSGGSGNDRIIGSSYNDYLQGGAGNDVINAGAGNDYLSGDSGRNILRGGEGNDTFRVIPLNGLSPDAANYGLLGGIDTIFGGSGDDTVYKFWNSSMVSAGLYFNDHSIENTITIDVVGGAG